MSDVTEALWRDADWHAATQAEKEARLAAATAAGVVKQTKTPDGLVWLHRDLVKWRASGFPIATDIAFVGVAAATAFLNERYGVEAEGATGR